MKDKIFNRYSILLVLAGLGINIGLAQLVLWLELPIFLDSVGTVFVAIFGGTIPGICVGFVSNLINSIGDPITRYYGVLSIAIAISATQFSKHGFFRHWWGYLVALLTFAFIGGAVGSTLTWLLYGLNVGEGISAPFALSLVEHGWQPFWAQFAADCGIDFLDKFLTLIPVLLLVLFFPNTLINKLPLGYVYDRKLPLDKILSEHKAERVVHYKNRSLRYKLVTITLVTGVIISVVSVIIGLSVYQAKIEERYVDLCNSATALMLKVVDGDDVESYLNGESTEKYAQTESQLREIYNAYEDILYMYVYDIEEDGVHVVFDLDTPDVPGDEAGDVIEFDNAFLPYLDTLLDGEEIEPIVSNESYGWLTSIYKPIKNSANETVAYACCDFDMIDLRNDIYEFIIQMISLLFGTFMIIVAFMLWYADRKIATPIRALVIQAEQFDCDSSTGSMPDRQKLLNLPVFKTGDELEVLHNAMEKTENEILGYVSEISVQKDEIAKMQRNIIYSFASMVENRDKNTGGHIMRTAAYVSVIARQLQKNPKYADVITAEYINDLSQSAPLHDIGKISISDIILNKPGRFTPEEYEIMKTHTTAGRDIVESALVGIKDGGYLEMAKELAAYHHERYDGKGYPEGLVGESIPLCARIMAISDVFDALLSKRSYKDSFAFDDAVKIIEDGRGTQFDPDAVDAFILCKSEVEVISQTNT